MTRVVTIGTGIDSCRPALAIAERHPGVVAALGIDPHRAATADAARVDELRRAPRRAEGRRGGRDRPRRAPRCRHAWASNALRGAPHARRRAPAPGRDPQQSGERGDRGRARAFPGTVVLHCFSEPDLLEPALERGYYVSFAGNVTYSSRKLRASAALVPPERISRPTAPISRRNRVRGRRNEPVHVMHTLAVLARARGTTTQELEFQIDGNATAAFRLGPG